MADRIINELATNKTLGLVFPDDPNCVGWSNNKSQASVIAERIGLKKLPCHFNFPVGTMFWAKRGALSKLYDEKFTWDDFPKEPIGYDGTMLHAIERLIPSIVKKSGYNYKLTYMPGITR